MSTYLGTACKNGHDGMRFTSGRACVQCSRDRNARGRAKRSALAAAVTCVVEGFEVEVKPGQGRVTLPDGRRIYTPEGLARVAAGRAVNQDAVRAQRRAYYARHAKTINTKASSRRCDPVGGEAVRAAYRARRGDPVAGEAMRAAQRTRYAARDVMWREVNIQRVKQATDARRAANPAKFNAYSANYRAMKLRQTPAWADHRAIADVYEQGYMFDGHVDHMVPLQGKLYRGLHTHDNLRLALPEENIAKSNRACKKATPELLDWITDGHYAERFARCFA